LKFTVPPPLQAPSGQWSIKFWMFQTVCARFSIYHFSDLLHI